MAQRNEAQASTPWGCLTAKGLDASPKWGFGKHREETILDVMNEAPDYCRWVVDEYKGGDCSEQLKIAAEWILENNPEFDEGRLMGYGKHKNKTMEWVYENDKDYIAWAMSKFEKADKDYCGRLAAFVRRSSSDESLGGVRACRSSTLMGMGIKLRIARMKPGHGLLMGLKTLVKGW
eukprot:s1523_g1.t1